MISVVMYVAKYAVICCFYSCLLWKNSFWTRSLKMDVQEVLGKILGQVHESVGSLLKIIMTFSFHSLYRREFDCTCSSLQSCVVYLLVPCLVIWILLLAADKLFHLSITRLVKEEKSRYVTGSCALKQLVLTFCGSLIWAASVLMDGDWFVCCLGDKSANQHNVTVLKNTSWTYGMCTLLLMAGLIFAISWLNLFQKDVKLFELLVEEEERAMKKYVREAMRTEADLELKDHVDRGEWRETFDKAEEIFKWKTSVQSPEISPSPSQDSTPDEDTPVENTDLTGSSDNVRRRPKNHYRRTWKENGTKTPPFTN